MSIEDIKKLRSQTGAGMNDAKAALEEAGGDFDKAVQVLRKAGHARASKKAEREANAGLIDSYVHMGRVGVLVEVNCETDFVAKTEDFRQFVHDIAMQVAASDPKYVGPDDVPGNEKSANQDRLEDYYKEVCLLNQPSIKEPDKSVQDLLTEAITKLGENIVVRRFSRYELGVADAK